MKLKLVHEKKIKKIKNPNICKKKKLGKARTQYRGTSFVVLATTLFSLSFVRCSCGGSEDPHSTFGKERERECVCVSFHHNIIALPI